MLNLVKKMKNSDLRAFSEFSQSIPKKGVESHHIYIFLFWLSGMTLTYSTILSSWNAIYNGDSKIDLSNLIFVSILIISIFSLYHQWKVYKGLTIIYNDIDVWKFNTAGFAGGKLDISLRIMMLIAILIAFSKMEFLRSPADSIFLSFADFSETDFFEGVYFGKVETYVFWISILFFLMFLWSFFALQFIRNRESRFKPNVPLNHECIARVYRKRHDTRASLIAWCITDLVAAIIWISLSFFLAFHQGAYSSWAILILGLFYITIVICRFVAPALAEIAKPHLQKMCAELLDWI